MSTFDEILKYKLEQIDEAGGVPGQPVQATQPTQQTGVPGATQTPQQNAPVQQAPTQTGTTAGPEQHLVNSFQQMDFKNPETAVKQINVALKNAGNVPGMQEFWQQVGYAPDQGFVLNPAAPTNQTAQPQANAQQAAAQPQANPVY